MSRKRHFSGIQQNRLWILTLHLLFARLVQKLTDNVPKRIGAARVGALFEVEHARSIGGARGKRIAERARACAFGFARARIARRHCQFAHVHKCVHVTQSAIVDFRQFRLFIKIFGEIQLLLADDACRLHHVVARAVAVAALGFAAARRVSEFARRAIVAKRAFRVGRHITFVGIRKRRHKCTASRQRIVSIDMFFKHESSVSFVIT
mmetsp:Transcript_5555/g.9306  ORF Transcript_5555/g.9306 Transcript_5555/m.9306 type:complete len:207 (-) Transcript_5555:710-1330(-)